MFEASVHTLTIDGPDDVGRVAELFDRGVIEPADVCAVLAQTEGDGFARGYFALSFELLLAERLGVARDEIGLRLPILVIGGTAGLMTPHVTLFERRRTAASGVVANDALAIGIAFTRVLSPGEIGTTNQVDAVAEAVRVAMADAGLADTDAVVAVELKCPQPGPAAIGAKSRGASALGTAVALGEIARGEVTDAAIGTRSDLYSLKASASSGGELSNVRVVVIGNRPGAPGSYRAGGGVMTDQLDIAGAATAFRHAGLRVSDGFLEDGETEKLAAVFVNAGADYADGVRGFRHTMKTDLLAGYSGHVAKAVAHATVSAIARTPLVLGNAGAEHQGPPGGNLVCVIANHAPATGDRHRHDPGRARS
jgi:cyanuric acid amidohydrolase